MLLCVADIEKFVDASPRRGQFLPSGAFPAVLPNTGRMPVYHPQFLSGFAVPLGYTTSPFRKCTGGIVMTGAPGQASVCKGFCEEDE